MSYEGSTVALAFGADPAELAWHRKSFALHGSDPADIARRIAAVVVLG